MMMLPIDRELLRLFDHDSDRPFPFFDDAGAVDTAYVTLQLQSAYQAKAFLQPTEPILKLVQSGRLMQMSLASPRSLASMSDARYSEAAFNALASKGAMCPPLTGITDYFNTLICTIIPALINKPKALTSWLVLSRTMIVLSNGGQWATASKYLDQLLASRVMDRESFSATANDIILSLGVVAATGSTPHPSSANSRSSNSKKSKRGTKRSSGGDSSSSASADRTKPCYDWNNRLCTRGSGCEYLHQCQICNSKSHVKTDCKKSAPGTDHSQRKREVKKKATAPAVKAESE